VSREEEGAELLEKPKVVRNEDFGDNDDDLDKGKTKGKAKELADS
jgi:hypothetical protein